MTQPFRSADRRCPAASAPNIIRYLIILDQSPIKGVGYVQAVFLSRPLVGLGSLDSSDGRLCGGCLDNMLDGKRDRLKGLPFHVGGVCPVCDSKKVVPLGNRLRPNKYFEDTYLTKYN